MDLRNAKVKSFRNDINGLRAWAVVSVVAYHFGIPGLQGGFVGVDIFFVISGFLMTGLIINGLDRSSQRKRFSLVDFYLARGRRIVPALAVVCAALLVVGWLLLPELIYTQLAEDVLSALLFISNIKFWHEAGYFDAASHEKWLLHTWSLSVEWQFYLVLPLVLMLLWRIWPQRKIITIWLFVGFVASLCLSAAITPLRSGLAFYLLPTRAWEMLAGGLVFLMASRWALSPTQRRWLEALGFVLMIAAMGLADSSVDWPGWRALVPVVGAAMVLWAARSESLWTGTKLAQWLGNASYSIYLWHWPVVVTLVYLDVQKNPWAVAIGMFASVALGYASFKWIEQTTRERLTNWNRPLNMAAWVAGVGAIALPCLAIDVKGGVAGRLDPRIDAVFAEGNNKNPRMRECHVTPPSTVPECHYGGPELGIIVMGDSHAASIIRSVENSMDDRDKYVLDWTYGGCPTMFDVHRTDPKFGVHCRQFVDTMLSKQASLEKAPLLIVNRNSVYLQGYNERSKESESGRPLVFFDTPSSAPRTALETQFKEKLIETACKFAQSRTVYLMRPIPELIRDVPKTMGRALIFNRHERVSISLAQYKERNRVTLEAQDEAHARCGVRILDPLPYLCRDGQCWGDLNGLPLYFDDNHLNERGAALLHPMFHSIFKSTSLALAPKEHQQAVAAGQAPLN